MKNIVPDEARRLLTQRESILSLEKHLRGRIPTSPYLPLRNESDRGSNSDTEFAFSEVNPPRTCPLLPQFRGKSVLTRRASHARAQQIRTLHHQARCEATKARRADWLPILAALVPELRAARPENWKANKPVFLRGVADPDTLRRDMAKVGILLADTLGRPVGIHTFRRTFISQLQKRGVHSRVIMQLARHKSLRLTDWTYTDTTMLPLAEGIETLAAIVAPASPCSSPLKIGQTSAFVSNGVQAEKTVFDLPNSEVVETEGDCPSVAHVVQSRLYVGGPLVRSEAFWSDLVGFR